MVTATQLLALPSAQQMGNKLQDVAAVIYGEGDKFSVAVVRHPNGSNLRKEGLILLRG